MGLLDLPAPVFTWADERLAGLLPPGARLIFWAALAALVSMELYRLTSPQGRLAELKASIASVRRQLAEHDGSFEEAGPLIGRSLLLALKRIALVLPATLLAALPIVCLYVWLDTAYGRSFPPAGQEVSVAVPGAYQGRWSAQEPGPPRVELLDGQGRAVADVPVKAPVPVLHKRAWWSLLIANPAGYLPEDWPVDRIDIALPRLELFHIGPDWMRGWEPAFILSLLLCAIPLKIVRRIE